MSDYLVFWMRHNRKPIAPDLDGCGGRYARWKNARMAQRIRKRERKLARLG